MGQLLYIYDANDPAVGSGPYDEDSAHRLGINTGEAGVLEALATLVKEGRTFNRVLWQTHGRAGAIAFARIPVKLDGNDLNLGKIGAAFDASDNSRQFIDANSFKHYARWTEGNFHKLFPQPTRMYFDGCNVAEGDGGWKFLEEAGRLLLRAGGLVMGWDSLGFNLWSGKTIHFWGDARGVFVGPGGKPTGRTDEVRAEEMKKIIKKFGF